MPSDSFLYINLSFISYVFFRDWLYEGFVLFYNIKLCLLNYSRGLWPIYSCLLVFFQNISVVLSAIKVPLRIASGWLHYKSTLPVCRYWLSLPGLNLNEKVQMVCTAHTVFCVCACAHATSRFPVRVGVSKTRRNLRILNILQINILRKCWMIIVYWVYPVLCQ